MSIMGHWRQKSLAVDESAWFLCRFLCRNLNEDNFEKVRDHVSICKGVKTRLKLSEKGLEIGYKPSHVRHYHHKIKYEILSLGVTENMIQDVMFTNVLLCVFHVQNLPGLEFEIIAFKFKKINIVKRFQDVCNILLGGMAQRDVFRPPGQSGNINLMPSKAYHMGALAPEKWASADRLNMGGSVGDLSEVSYGKSPRGVHGYGHVVPANEVQRQGMGVDDAASFTSSGKETFREVAVSANLDRTPSSPNARPILNINRSKPYAYEGHMVEDTGTQAAVATGEEGWSNYPNHLRAESGSVVSAQSSGVFDENTGRMIHNNGVSLAYSSNPSRHNNITLTDMEVMNNPRHDKQMTSSVHRIFKKGKKGRSKVSESSGITRDRYPSTNESYKSSSQYVDEFNGRHVLSSSRSDIYPQADTMSVRSQGSYYLVPTFKKVYAPRSGRAMTPTYRAEGSVYLDSRSRAYASSKTGTNARY